MKYFLFFLYILLFIFICLSFSCKHEEALTLNAWDTYKMKEGHHGSDKIHVYPFHSNHLEFDAIFDSSCIYKSIDPINQYDINKLMGFSDCLSAHHKNSARFGWNWNDSLNIYAYCYADGKLSNQYITSVKPDQMYRYIIIIERYKYKFYVAGKIVEMDRGCDGCGSGYLLFPYFGGDEVADHDISINLRIL